MDLNIVRIEKPNAYDFVLGQTRSAETVDEIHEALVKVLRHPSFGIAYCEASGKRLVRCAGTDALMLEMAKTNAVAIGAGDTFVVFFREASCTRDVLNAIKALPEVCRIFCATANPAEVIVATTEQGRGVVGIIDGFVPKGVESDEDIAWRKDYLLHVAGYRT